jgi:hypothetical protein
MTEKFRAFIAIPNKHKPGDLRLSNSEMTAYRRCKRKWYVTTYLRLGLRAGNAPGSALSIGNLVHDALASYYDPEVRADRVAFIREHIQIAVNETPGNEDDLRKEEALCVAMLEGYLMWLEDEGVDMDITVLGTERMVEVPLAEGATLISKLDAPVFRESDGARLAFEHKTVGGLDQMLPMLKLDTQLLTEHLVLFLDYIEKGATPEDAYDQCHGILYNMLKKVKRTASAKPPFYGRVDVPHNIHELRNHWRHCVAIAREIQATRAQLDAGGDHHTVCPPNPKRECTWDCPVFRVCVMFDDGSDIDGALEAMYEKIDPLERYVGVKSLEV